MLLSLIIITSGAVVGAAIAYAAELLRRRRETIEPTLDPAASFSVVKVWPGVGLTFCGEGLSLDEAEAVRAEWDNPTAIVRAVIMPTEEARDLNARLEAEYAEYAEPAA